MPAEIPRRTFLLGALGLSLTGCTNNEPAPTPSRETQLIPTIQLATEIPPLDPEKQEQARHALRRVHREGYPQSLLNGTIFTTQTDSTQFMITLNSNGLPYVISEENGNSSVKDKFFTSNEFPNLTLIPSLGQKIPDAMVLQEKIPFSSGETFYHLSLDPQINTVHVTGGQLITTTHGEKWLVAPPTSANPEEQKEKITKFFRETMPGGVVLNRDGKPVGIATNSAHRVDIRMLEADHPIRLRRDGNLLPHVPALRIGFTPLWRGDEAKFKTK